MKRPHPGRPPIYSDNRVTMNFKDLPEIRTALNQRAAAEGKSFQVYMSDLVRSVVGVEPIKLNPQED